MSRPLTALIFAGTAGALALACRFDQRLRNGWSKLARNEPSAPQRGRQTAARLGYEAQWTRLVGMVEDAIDHGQRAAEYHTAARCRLDASEYELRRLREDLAAVLERPSGVLTLVAPRQKPAHAQSPVALAA
jgi:hypothetical protein